MPTAKAKAPKYCLHKPSGRAYIRIRGRVRYVGEHGTPESLETYGRLAAELASQSNASVAVPAKLSAGMTVVALADAYWQFGQGYYRKKDGTPRGWLDHIHLVLHTHHSGLYGRTPAAEFGPKAFKAIRQTLVDAKNSRGYVKRIIPRFRSTWWSAGLPSQPGIIGVRYFIGFCSCIVRSYGVRMATGMNPSKGI